MCLKCRLDAARIVELFLHVTPEALAAKRSPRASVLGSQR